MIEGEHNNMVIRTISEELKKQYGQKIYRLALSSGCTCPNRDGSISRGGCTFCSEGGSGDFAAPYLSIKEQIQTARQRVDRKLPKSQQEKPQKYIAYFQSFTNTYARDAAELERLTALYIEAIRRPDIVILSLGTRPDCLGPEILDMLAKIHAAAPEKSIWIELGLQTMHDETARRVNRGYDRTVFEDAYRRLRQCGSWLQIIVHLILGLPGETREDILESVRYLSRIPEGEVLDDTYPTCPSIADGRSAVYLPPPDGVKLQLLHVLKGTELAAEYGAEPFPLPTMEEYCDLVVDCLRELPEETIVHRMTGDGPKSLLIAPLWSADKKRVLNMLNRKIREA